MISGLPCAASPMPWTGPACDTRSCGATASTTGPWRRSATAPARTCSCGASPTSPFNIPPTPRRHEQPPPVRPHRDRRVLPGVARDRLLGRAARKERERRLLPGQPGCRLVRGGGEPVRVEHRERASGRPRGHRGGERARGGPLRVARLPHPAAPGLVVHAVFFFQAEDGIRDLYVTGVQTCALPISALALEARIALTLRTLGGLSTP